MRLKTKLWIIVLTAPFWILPVLVYYVCTGIYEDVMNDLFD